MSETVAGRGAGRERPVLWVDESHPVIRRGIAASLVAAGFTMEGESSKLVNIPSRSWSGILLFEADPDTVHHLSTSGMRDTRHLVAIVRAGVPSRFLYQLASLGVAAILIYEELTPELLVMTVAAVAQGRVSLPEAALPKILAQAAERSTLAAEHLSEREREVLRLLALGGDTRGIATQMCYSERTVKNVVHDVLTKLNCRTRAQAVGLATRTGAI